MKFALYKLILSVSLVFVVMHGGCFPNITADTDDVFSTSDRLKLTGLATAVKGNIVELGELLEDEVLRILAEGDTLLNVLLVRLDANNPGTGFIVGGGPANASFTYLVPSGGRYFIFLEYAQNNPDNTDESLLSVSLIDEVVVKPTTQKVRIVFTDGYLTEPGLLDPIDGTPEDRELLESLDETIQAQVLTELNRVFAGTPIEILASDDDAEGESVSTLRFEPTRVLSDDQDSIDIASPLPDFGRPQCFDRVVYGEIEPHGAHIDIGNRTLDDEAVVYVGSLQGQGLECRTAVTNSVSSIVLTLAQTAAHEIGHLVGFHHVDQIDIMNGTATVAFFRELAIGRGQLQIDQVSEGGELITLVNTALIQDPDVYYAAIFDTN